MLLEDFVVTLISEGEKRGISKGRAQGRVQGRAKGITQVAIYNIPIYVDTIKEGYPILCA